MTTRTETSQLQTQLYDLVDTVGDNVVDTEWNFINGKDTPYDQDTERVEEI